MGSNISLRVSKIAVGDLLQRPEKEPNPEIWEKKINGLTSKQDVQFYVSEPDTHCSYARFFVSFKDDGILFFDPFTPFLERLTTWGFCLIDIDDEGFVEKHLVPAELPHKTKYGYLEDTPESRAFIRARLTRLDIMVSNTI